MTNNAFNEFSFEKIVINDSYLENVWIETNKNKKTSTDEKIAENLWQTGNQLVFKKRILNLINSAKKIICLCSFLFVDHEIKDALIDKATQDVRIYILSSPETRLLDLDDEDNLHELTKETKNMLRDLSPYALIRTATFFHAKFIVIDPHSNPQAILSTANFNERALSENIELGIYLKGQRAYDLFLQFIYGFWKLAEREDKGGSLTPISNSSKSKLDLNLKEPEINPVTIKTKNDEGILTLKKKATAIIKEAEDTIYVGAYGFNLDSEVTKELVNALKEKKKVIIFTRPRTKSTHIEALRKLADLNATIYGNDTFHAKFVLTPSSKKGIIFSANFEKKGMEEGFESGIFLTPEETNLLYNHIANEWQNSFKWVFKNKIKISELKPQTRIKISDKKGNALLEKVVEEKTTNTHNLEKIESLEKLPSVPINNTNFDQEEKIFQTILHKINIKLPTLPKKVKKHKLKNLKDQSNQSTEFIVYTDENNTAYISLKLTTSNKSWDLFQNLLNEKMKDIQKIKNNVKKELPKHKIKVVLQHK